MSVEIGAPARASAGNVLNPRANEAREGISASQVFDWVMRGYVFSCGLLVDDTTNIPTAVTLEDVTATVTLQSPRGGDTVVVPLRVSVTVIDEPGGMCTVDLAFTKAAEDCLTALTLTGTTLTGVINHKSRGGSAKSTLLSTVTVSATTVVDGIVIASWAHPDEGLVGATWGEPRFDYLFKDNPIVLMDGAALLIQGYAATTAAEVRPTICWAELPASIYKP